MLQPSRDDYLRKAQQNKGFAHSVKGNDPASINWSIIAAFYSAVHFVNAFGAKYNKRYSDHRERNDDVRRNPQLEHLSDDYLDLHDLAWNARYTMRNYTSTERQEALQCLEVVETELRKLL